MKKIFLTVLMGILALSISVAQNYKPYTMGATMGGSFSDVKQNVKTQLKANGFEILGEYQPANDANRWLIAITSGDLKSAVKKVGGFTGFAAALRVAISKENGNTIVSYTTPAYWGNAYFRGDFSKVKSLYDNVASKLKAALGTGKQFGSEDGMSAKDLRSYHYTMGMPRFDDNIKLKTFASYSAAVAAVDANLSAGVANVKKVYAIEIPGMNIKLYGIGLSGADGESSFLPVIDKANPKHTAFLPYEMLIYKGNVYMLHGRFRIALSFPDLSMGTFMKIVSTPGNIEEMLKSTTK